jgi:hypothetical protein
MTHDSVLQENHNFRRRPTSVGADLALLLFILGVYSGVDLFGQGVLVPYVICALVAPYLALKAGRGVKAADALVLFTLVFISALGVLLAPEADVYFLERLKGLIYLSYSLTLSYLSYVLLRRWGPDRVAWIYGWIVVVLISGCTLENYTPFKRLSDAFRVLVFDEAFLYENDPRDLKYFGQIRPKLFTEEPSYLALFFLLAVFAWFALSKARHRYLKFVVAVSLGFFLIRSPIVLLAFPLALLTEVFLPNGRNAAGRPLRYGRRGLRRIAAIGSLAVLGVLVIGLAIRMVLRERFELVRSGKEASTVIRIVAPVLIAQRVATTHPFWGAGITGKEFVANELATVYSGLGFDIRDPNRIINVLWLYVIYYGIGAGLLMAIAFYMLMRRMGARHTLFTLGSILVFAQGMGAFVGLRTWFFIFMVFLVSCFSAGTHAASARQCLRLPQHARAGRATPEPPL